MLPPLTSASLQPFSGAAAAPAVAALLLLLLAGI